MDKISISSEAADRVRITEITASLSMPMPGNKAAFPPVDFPDNYNGNRDGLADCL